MYFGRMTLWVLFAATILASENKEIEKDDTCRLCFAHFTMEKKRFVTPCNSRHPFCQDCLLNYHMKQQKSKCCYCKENIFSTIHKSLILHADAILIKNAITIIPEIFTVQFYQLAKETSTNLEIVNLLKSYCTNTIRLYKAIRQADITTIEQLLGGNEVINLNIGLNTREKPLTVAVYILSTYHKFLELAAQRQDVPAIRLLKALEHKKRYERMIKILIENGANVNRLNSKDSTLLYEFVESNDIEMTRFLLQNEANPNLPEYSEGHGNLLPIWNAETPEMAKLLIQYGARIHEIYDEEKFSLLTNAVSMKHIDLIAFYANQGLNLEHEDIDNFTPLLHAIKENLPECITFLAKSGVDLNKNYEEMLSFSTPLGLAISKNYIHIADILLQYGASVKAHIHFLTPLQYTLAHGRNLGINRKKMTKLLISHGANPFQKDEDENENALDVTIFGNIKTFLLNKYINTLKRKRSQMENEE